MQIRMTKRVMSRAKTPRSQRQGHWNAVFLALLASLRLHSGQALARGDLGFGRRRGRPNRQIAALHCKDATSCFPDKKALEPKKTKEDEKRDGPYRPTSVASPFLSLFFRFFRLWWFWLRPKAALGSPQFFRPYRDCLCFLPLFPRMNPWAMVWVPKRETSRLVGLPAAELCGWGPGSLFRPPGWVGPVAKSFYSILDFCTTYRRREASSYR